MEVHWVPGHVGVEGNEQAGRITKTEAKDTGARRCTEQFASLAYINQTIMQRK